MRTLTRSERAHVTLHHLHMRRTVSVIIHTKCAIPPIRVTLNNSECVFGLYAKQIMEKMLEPMNTVCSSTPLVAKEAAGLEVHIKLSTNLETSSTENETE